MKVIELNNNDVFRVVIGDNKLKGGKRLIRCYVNGATSVMDVADRTVYRIHPATEVEVMGTMNWTTCK
jgi:hypothetical protein